MTKVAVQEEINHGARGDKAKPVQSLGLIYRFEGSLCGTKSIFQSGEPNKKEKSMGSSGTKFNYQNLVSIFVTENDKLLGNSIKYCNSNCIWIKFIFESSQVSACCSLMK